MRLKGKLVLFISMIVACLSFGLTGVAVLAANSYYPANNPTTPVGVARNRDPNCGAIFPAAFGSRK